jgi:hypothetical protein
VRDCVRNGIPFHLCVNRAAKTQVEDPRTIIHSPANSGGDIRGRANTSNIARVRNVHNSGEHPDGHDSAVPRYARNTSAVVREARDRSGDMGSVTDFVLRIVVATLEIPFKSKPRRRHWARTQVDHICTWNQKWRELWVVQIHSCIYHCNNYCRRALCAIPSGRAVYFC